MINYYSTAAFIPMGDWKGFGGFMVYDSMHKYDIDDETKEDWKDIITNL